MGPKWSDGTVTKIRPLAALASPPRTARSVTNASSGRASLAIFAAAAAALGARSPRFACARRKGVSPAQSEQAGRAMRMAQTSAALMRGLERTDGGMGARQVGQDVLDCCTHLVKQTRQKLCWQGACRSLSKTSVGGPGAHAP